MRTLILSLVAVGVWTGGAKVAFAQSAENVAVVINAADPASIRVGEYYVQKRSVPAANVIRINASSDDVIERVAYVRDIENPIAIALARGQLQDRIHYLVLTKGVPLRIAGTTGQSGTTASVDSELTLLYRRMLGVSVLTLGRVDNPYFLGTRSIDEAKPFTHKAHDLYLVSRLDGFTVEDVFALIDRASAPATAGSIVLDQRDGLSNSVADAWLAAAGKRLTAAGYAERVQIESTPKPSRGVSPVLGYYSWGSGDPANRVRTVGMGFANGALAATFVSADARTFKEPPKEWLPTTSSLRSAAFGGSSHSLVGDLIREGVTGVAGHVVEPYTQSVVRPDVLFSAYLAGHNLIEAFYLAIPHLSWQTVVIGDPLCAPFPRKAPDTTELESGIDPDTELPRLFSARRIAEVARQSPSASVSGIAAWIRSVSLRGRGDGVGARQALEQAVAAAPVFVTPRLELAQILDAAGETDAAVAHYRRIVELEPNNIVALNNLAYSLAVNKGQVAEGLVFAKRAVALVPTQGPILDTLAWLEHLAGDDASAARRLADAVRRAPKVPVIRLHAAIVFAAIGSRERAEAELAEALKLDPSLAESPEVKDLKVKLAPPSEAEPR